MKVEKKQLLLYAVTDRSWLNGDTLYSQVEKALKGGVTFLQLREKHLSEQDFLEEAKRIKPLCARYNVPFIINDDVDTALKAGADGVHIGQDDMTAAEARSILGENKIIGVSAHSVEEAVNAERNGADYLGVGAAFHTGSKGDANVIEHKVIKDICSAVSIPVIAIGGIGMDNVMELAGSGICGVAVISAVFAQKDIEGSARRLKECVLEMVKA